MLTIWGTGRRFCDGVSRREFLRAGAISGLLSLADVFRLKAQAGQPASRPPKSVIMIYLLGGPSHLDTFDPKPNAPAEYRGPFRPIPTSIVGVQVCEHFPRLAAMMDRLSIIRSLSATPPNGHSDSEILTGRTEDVNPRLHHPCFGSVVSKLRGMSADVVPPYVCLRKMTFPTTSELPQWTYYRQPGFLGKAHLPFLPTSGGVRNSQLPAEVDRPRLGERLGLLTAFDTLRRDLDASGTAAALDDFQRRAVDVLTSPVFRNALDLSREDPRLIERYSLPKDSRNSNFAQGYTLGSQLLLARRLVEAGVGFVEVALGYWDTHGPANVLGFPHLRDQLCPRLDRGLSALLEDLQARGLAQDVVVIAWGEFGRTPRINKVAGRDHWLPAMSALIAGGGLKTGQVIGSTDRRGEAPKERPYRVSNVLSTLYRTIGIDPALTFPDQRGRPRHLLDERQPVAELA
jgi:hypothetical protein